MSPDVDKFCEDVLRKISHIYGGLGNLKARIGTNRAFAEREVRGHLDKVRERVAVNQVAIAAAQSDVKIWAEEQRATTHASVQVWKTRRDASKLKRRAEKAERYAKAASDLAAHALDVAEEAALEAWLAREDARAALAKMTPEAGE